MSAERVKPSVNRKNRWIAAALVLPGVLFIVFFMLVPLFSLCLTSFFPGERFSLSSYFSLFGDVYFQQVFIRSLRLSLLSTALCALLGFPTAYYIAKHSRHKGMMMALAVFPMFTSPVIRSFSWMVILGKKGIVNSALVSLGIFAKPQSLLYNEFSMTVGFVQLFLPLMILSLIGVMDPGRPERGGRKPRRDEARRVLPRRFPAEHLRPGHGQRARVHRLHDGLYHPAASRRHGYPRAGDDDLSIRDEPSRLGAGLRRGGCDDRGDDDHLRRVQRPEPKD